MKQWNNRFEKEGTISIKQVSSRQLDFDYKPIGKFCVLAPNKEVKEIHHSNISSIDVSSSGNLGVSASLDEGLLVWNTEDFSVVRNLKGHGLDVEKARFFPSGLVVLSAGLDMTVRIFDVATGDNMRTLMGHTRGK